MLFDSCTWDEDYNLGVVQSIRQQLVALATPSAGYTSVLLQGSGSFAVEGVLGTAIGPQDKLLIVNNGAYGARMIEMARLMDIDHHAFDCGEVNEPDVAAMEAVLKNDARISHIAMVHCETTTGMLNPLQKVAGLAARNGKTFIVDAMSSFGGIPLDVDALGIDFLISSANKCIQGCRGSLSSSPPQRAGEMCRPFALAVAGSVCPVALYGRPGRQMALYVADPHRVGLCAGAERTGTRGRHCRAPPPLSDQSAAAGGGYARAGL